MARPGYTARKLPRAALSFLAMAAACTDSAAEGVPTQSGGDPTQLDARVLVPMEQDFRADSGALRDAASRARPEVMVDGAPNELAARDPEERDSERKGEPEDAGAADGGTHDTSVWPNLDASSNEDAAAADVRVMPPATCAPPLGACDAVCIDLSTDPRNCGTCGRRCSAATSTCHAGRCVAPPPAGCTYASRMSRLYLFCSATRTWEDARRSCLSSGMDLAIVDDAGENEFVSSFAMAAWIGASDNEFDGRWSIPVVGDAERFAGPAVRYENWARGQPDGTWRCSGELALGQCREGVLHREACARIAADGTWSDAACVQDFEAYVCEEYRVERR